MKILYLTQWFATPYEPGLSRAYQFAKTWAKEGHEVYVVTSQIDHLSFKNNNKKNLSLYHVEHIENFTVIRIWSSSHGRRGVFQRLKLFFSFAFVAIIVSFFLVRPSIVYASSPPTTVGLVGLIVSKFYHIPLIYEIRDRWPEFLLAGKILKCKFLLYIIDIGEKLCIRNAKKTVILSKEKKDKKENEKERQNKFVYIPHGVDDWMIDDFRKTDRDQDGKIKCLYAGSFSKFHCIEQLLDVAKILSKDPYFYIEIIGDGDGKEQIFNYSHQLNIKNVVFKPLQGKRDIFLSMQKSDICILASGTHSYYSSWLPNKIFDYLASGTPVVASATGELAQIISNSGGTVVEPENTYLFASEIRRVGAFPISQRKEIGEFARLRIAREYLRKNQALDVLKLFTEKE